MIAKRRLTSSWFYLISLLLILNSPGYAQDSALQEAESLNQQVEKLYEQGRYQEGIVLAEKALAIMEKAVGSDHPNVATSLNTIAVLYLSLGEYAKAAPLSERALPIYEKALGPDHPHVATSLSNLAELYRASGDYAKAEPLYYRSLAIREKALGPDHPDVAVGLNNIAVFYQSLGDYARAEPLYRRSLAIKEKTVGPDHPAVATTLNNLAEIYRALDDYPRAEPLYRRSLAITEKALGPDHPAVATSLHNLALLYASLGDYANAEPLYMRSLAIYEKALGPDNPNVATSLSGLALLHKSKGDYAHAEPLYKRSLAIRKKAFGPDHPDVAGSLNNIAGFYESLGDYASAEPLFNRSLVIYEKVLGPDHPNVALSLSNLAVVYAALDDFRKAHDLLLRALAIDARLVDHVMGFTSEDRKLTYLGGKKWALNGFLSLTAVYLSKAPLFKKNALDVWLSRKGVILEAQKRFQEALVYSDDPQVLNTFQELARVRAQLSKLVFGGPGKEGVEAYQKRIADLEDQKGILEARLSQLSQAFASHRKIAKADSETVSQALPINMALVEFAGVDVFNFKARGKETRWLPAGYLAFVLHAGKGDRVEMVDLGDAGEIDRAVALFKKEIGEWRDKEAVKAMETSGKIHDLVFEPLKKAIGEVKEVFISPDGNLNLIPFEVLRGPDGRFLIEDYTFNYLAAGRDIIGFGEIKEKGGKALLMGDPDFDMGADEKGSTLRKLALREPRHADKDENPKATWIPDRVRNDKRDENPVVMHRRSSDMRGFQFSRLPGAREEVEAIKGLVGVGADIYTGKEALEEVLRQKGTPGILHLATHGFFLSDLDLSALRDADQARGITIQAQVPMPVAKGVKVENPLLRSGIALAGANNALKTGEVEKSDGIVTAEKILGLKLRGCDMVVLSACETGVGEVKTGEGVYGLRRAFIQAGTKGLVMSMWSVPDKETKELMVEFYKNVLSGKMNR